MNQEAYKKLAGVLNGRSMAIPAVVCDEFYALTEFLFTEDEAAINCAMPDEYATVEEIAANLGTKNLTKLAAQLETMGDKGLIHIKQSNGVKLYEGLPLVPGLIEFQLMRGLVDERHKKFAFLLRDYSKAIKREFMSATPPKLERTVPGKKIKVDKEIRNVTTVLPYKEVKELIQNTDFIAAGTCVCRHQGNLIGKPSSEPLNNCMVFGESAKFAVERGFTQRLTKEEALKRLEAAEEAGLVHNYANTPGRFTNLLCNCCGCHCWIIKGAKNSPFPSRMVNARYLVCINETECTACEACVERCWMQALKMVDGKLVRDENRCIGCGLCMWACPTDALYLEAREEGKIALARC